jgi:large subunit ribosomal protein L17
MVTLAKKGQIAGRRKALGMLDNSREVTGKLFTGVAKAFSNKTSGFTRIVSLPRRSGDNAKMVRLEWTERVEFEVKKKETKEAAKKEVKPVKKAVKKETKKK